LSKIPDGGKSDEVAPRLSLAIVSLNEELNLARCLESAAGLADEIVVLDSGSTDGTRAVAERHGAKWHFREWDHFHGQKNAALALCTGRWTLSLDCDEALSPKLRDSIREFLDRDGDGCAGAEFPRMTQFLGRWIRHGEWYPDWALRLFLREKGRFGGGAGHDRVEVDGKVARLEGELLHYSYPTINSYISKMNSFSDAFLSREIYRGARWSPLANIFRPWWRFFRGYVIRLGFLDGFPGFWVAIATSFAAFVRHSRLYERELAEKSR
jgi:glycosyltransferase involved in cell wall biosynthesis